MKKGTSIYGLIAILVLAFLAVSCFSPWAGDEAGGTGTLVFKQEDASAARSLIDTFSGGGPGGTDPEFYDFTYILTLFSASGTRVSGIPLVADTTHSTLSAANVPAGTYNRIAIHANGPNPYPLTPCPLLYAKPSPMTRAIGEIPISITVTGGQTTTVSSPTISMIAFVAVSNWAELDEAVNFVPGGVTPGATEEIIFLDNSSFASTSIITISRYIRLRGGGVQINRDPLNSAEFFTVVSGGMLQLEPTGDGDLILDGGSGGPGVTGMNATAALISVNIGVDLKIMPSGGSTNVILQNNRVVENAWGIAQGGAVHLNGGTFDMNGGLIQYNEAVIRSSAPAGCMAQGGGVYVSNGNFNMNGGIIQYNEAFTNTTLTSNAEGGGVYVSGTSATVFTMNNDAKIYNNKADYPRGSALATLRGGGVFITGGAVSFNMNGGATVESNFAWDEGGGIYNDGGTFTMQASTVITNNIARWTGGGIFMNAGVTTMNGNTIQNNVASDSDAGGVYITGGIFNFNSPAASGLGGTIINNTSYGGTYNNFWSVTSPPFFFENGTPNTTPSDSYW